MFSHKRPVRKATTNSIDLVYFENVHTMPLELLKQIKENPAYSKKGIQIACLLNRWDIELIGGSAILAYDKEIPGKPIVGHVFFVEYSDTVQIKNLVGENHYCSGVGSQLMEAVLQTATRKNPEVKKIILEPDNGAIGFYEKWNFVGDTIIDDESIESDERYMMEFNLGEPIFAQWPTVEMTEARLPPNKIEMDPFEMAPITSLDDPLSFETDPKKTALLFHGMFNADSYYESHEDSAGYSDPEITQWRANY